MEGKIAGQGFQPGRNADFPVGNSPVGKPALHKSASSLRFAGAVQNLAVSLVNFCSSCSLCVGPVESAQEAGFNSARSKPGRRAILGEAERALAQHFREPTEHTPDCPNRRREESPTIGDGAS